MTSDKTAKTRRVEIPRLVKHPRYGKYLRRKTVCYVHDENNESHAGDMVEIIESPAAVAHQALEAGAGRGQGTLVDVAAMRARPAANGKEPATEEAANPIRRAGINEHGRGRRGSRAETRARLP